jgi:hypothetical protein
MRIILPQIPFPVVQVGTRDEFIPGVGVDFTGRSMLETVSIFRRAIAFVGPLSSQLVLASGFPIPRIIPVRQENDMVPVERTPFDHYVSPKPEKVLDMLMNSIAISSSQSSR